MKNKRAGGVIYSVWMVFISIHHVGFVKRKEVWMAMG